MKERIMELPLHKIHPNLRSLYRLQDIEAVQRAIQSQGLKEPIQIWFDGERFRILDGEKRWRACKRLGITRIRARIA
jgi:ParB family chromosome partitioning protein